MAGRKRGLGRATGSGRKARPLTKEELDKIEKVLNIYHARKGNVIISELARYVHLPSHFVRNYLVRFGHRTVAGQYVPRKDAQGMTQEIAQLVAAPAAAAASLLANLPKERKRAIREALDQWFDTKNGTYSEGKSDMELGRLLDVPWAAVAYLRDDLYGSIKADPAIEDLRIEIEQLRHQIAQFNTRDLDGWLLEYNQKMADLDKLRKELRELYDVINAERQTVQSKISELRAIADQLAEKQLKAERRFGS